MAKQPSVARSLVCSLGVLVVLGGCSPRVLRSEPVAPPVVDDGSAAQPAPAPTPAGPAGEPLALATRPSPPAPVAPAPAAPPPKATPAVAPAPPAPEPAVEPEPPVEPEPVVTEAEAADERELGEPVAAAPKATTAPVAPSPEALRALTQVVDDGSEPPASAQQILGDARVHAITAVQRYVSGDLPGAHAELDVALKTLLAGDLPQGAAGLRLLQKELPEAYASQDLVSIYEAAEAAGAATEAVVPLDELVEQGPGVGGPQGVGDVETGDGGAEPARDVTTTDALEDAADALDDPSYIRSEIDRIARAFGETEVGEHETFQREVERFIRYYQVEKRGFYERSLARSLKYMDMVEEVLAEKGVPKEMAFIAFVESGFRPRATSPAGARGLWQFMPRTARAYGLQVDQAVDQRLDPRQATIAAREYFLDLVAIFGSRSFLLAMASYNAGEGRVQACLKQLDDPFNQRTFWHIAPCLREETREYIPRIIAAAVIASDPERFGFTPWGTVGTGDYDIVTVPEPTSIGLLASWSGIDLVQLRDMNPDLMASDTTTPKQAEAYPLIVPAGKGQVVERELIALGLKSSLLAGAASAAPADAAKSAPPPAKAPAGMTEPAPPAVAVAKPPPAKPAPPATEPAPPAKAAPTQPDPVKASAPPAEPAPQAKAPPAKAAPPPAPAPAPKASAPALKAEVPAPAVAARPPEAPRTQAPLDADGNPRTKFIRYKAQAGNTLAQIAQDFEKPEAKLLSWNPYLKDRAVREGDVVFIYELDWSYQRHLHPVEAGETLSGLSQRYRVPMDMIARWNGIEGGRLKAGDTLVIYTRDGLTAEVDAHTSPAKARALEASGHPFTYVFQEGNSLSRLSGYYGVGIDDLKAWNGLGAGEPEVGARLTLYTAEKVEVVSHTVAAGETLADLSRTYNVKLSYLADTNGLSRDARLRVGQALTIYIP